MNSKSIAGPNLAWVLRRGLPKAEVFRPKLLAEGLGHIFGKSFRYDGQSVLITISFLQFFLFQI